MGSVSSSTNVGGGVAGASCLGGVRLCRWSSPPSCRRVWALVAVVVVALSGVSCGGGPERSTESFCATLRSEKARILDQFNATSHSADASGDDLASLFAGLGGSIQALGELRAYFHKLAEVAPDEIRTEAELVADNYDEQMDAAGDAGSNPLGALTSSLFNGLAVSGQLDRLNQFAVSNCGEGI